MDIQEIIVLLLFLAAAGSIGWKIYKSFDNKKGGGCSKGCGCSADQKMKIS